MKAYWESGSIAPLILWPQHYMEVSGLFHAPVALTPRDRAPGTHWIGGWVDPTAVLDTVVKRKIPNSRRESNLNPNRPARSPALYRLSYRGSLIYWQNGGITRRILNVGTKWKWVVSLWGQKRSSFLLPTETDIKMTVLNHDRQDDWLSKAMSASQPLLRMSFMKDLYPLYIHLKYASISDKTSSN
jgi:hypothetical protein